MPIRIFTLGFNEATESFNDDLLEQFCLNKRIYHLESRFFTRHGQPFWTVAIHYSTILSGELEPAQEKEKKTVYAFDDQQRVLYDRLRAWRKQASEDSGIPAYMICNNRQFAQMILQQCTTLESLKLVRGFGASRIEKHGRQITELVKSFYDTNTP